MKPGNLGCESHSVQFWDGAALRWCSSEMVQAPDTDTKGVKAIYFSVKAFLNLGVRSPIKPQAKNQGQLSRGPSPGALGQWYPGPIGWSLGSCALSRNP